MNIQELIRPLDEIASGFQRAAILFTAVKGGVFALLEQPQTAESIAKALAWSQRSTRMLLDGLVALDLTRKENHVYTNTALASQCLVPGGPADQTHIMLHRAGSWAGWSHLEEAMRTGAGVVPEAIHRSAEELRAFICGMADIARFSAKEVIQAVALSPYRRLLDVGGGPGPYTVAFLQANVQMRATIFDLPEVIPIAREQVTQAGLTGRVEFVPGDFTRDDLGNGYDLALLSNIIHSYGPQTNQELIRKCYDALEPGGLLILKDFLVDAGRTGPPFALIFALHMLVHTQAGDTYTIEEVAQWSDSAGFAPGKLVDITPQSRLWLARKP